MSETMPRVHGPDERRPLDPGTRIGDALLVLKLSATGSAGFAYEGLSLRDQSNVTLVECCPVGVAVRGDDTSVNAIRGWEQDFADRLAAFERRATLLQAHPHPALEVCGETIAALGTRFVCQSIDAASPMDEWSNTLFKRASAPDLEAIAGRVASALLALYDQGLGHGAVSVATIRLTTPADARLSGLMLSECDAGSAVADMHGLAQILYAQVTGRSAPPPDRDRSLDAGRSAHHIAAGDYPDALLQMIDAALGLDGGTSEPEARDWLAGVAGWAAAPAAVPKPAPEAPRQTPQPAEPSLSRAPNPAEASPPVARSRSIWPILAVVSLLLVVSAAWLGYRLLSPAPATGPEVAVAPKDAQERAVVPPQPAAPAASVPAPMPVPAPAPAVPPAPVVVPAPAVPPAAAVPPAVRETPEPPPAPPSAPPAQLASPVTAPPAAPPDPAAELREAVSRASSRESLVELLDRGADRAQVEERFAAIGYVALKAGSETVFRKPGDGEALRDCADCPELVLVPAGRVSMKLTIANAPRDFAIDIPSALAIGRHEVTRAQFDGFVSATGRKIEPGCHVRAPSWRLDPALSWRQPGFAQGDDEPVVCVSLEDAQAFAAWLSRKTGQNYRLPTDAEWHYLAAAEDWDRGDANLLCAIGNGADRSAMEAHPQWTGAGCRDGFVATSPVGRFAPSLWGLFDLNGNVWEWVSTCAPEPRPDAVFPATSCAASAPRILRGGSFADPPQMRLLDARIVSAPAIRDQVVGFRVVRDNRPN